MSNLIRGAGGGGGGGGQTVQQTVVNQTITAPTRAAVRDPDNLASKQYATFVDLLGEGEIEGFPSAISYTQGTADYNRAALKDIYLNGTPILRSSASVTNPQPADYNFQNVGFEPRFGTQAQTYISGFSNIEDEKSVSLKVEQATPVTRTITDTNVDAARVTITVPRLEYYNDQGDVLGTSVSLSIQVQYNGGGFTTVLTDTISGRTADQYQRDYVINFAGSFPIDLRVVRNTADSADNTLINDIFWSAYTEIVYEKLRYPNSALVAMRLDAEQFSSIPSRTYRVRGLKIQIPNNATVDPSTGRLIYSGAWDGTFGAAVWTSDPAWVLWDLLTSTRYGFGDHIDAAQLDKWAFFSASQYASALIDDGFGGREPRFSCNALIQNQDEAYKLINDLCSVMRVMPFWATGTLTISQDKPADPSYLFTLANVTEEGFNYSGSSIKTRNTVAVISYLDLETQDLAYEVVEDHEGISKYGVVTTEIKAFACTSRGQAHRLGEWLLYSQQHETEVVSFTASMDAGVVVRPGQVIEIADPVRAGIRRGGRIRSATKTQVTVDDTTSTALTTSGNATLSVIAPDGSVETRGISEISGAVITVESAFDYTPNANSIWLLQNDEVQATQWRVVSIEERDGSEYSINALSYNASKYNYVERGNALAVRTVSTLTAIPDAPTNLQYAETLYELFGRAAAKIIVSWQPVVGVSEYRVQWKRGDGNWSTDVVPRPDYEILDSAADTYYFRVYSLNAARSPSNVPAEVTIDAVGKTAPPSDVTGLSLVPIDEASGILSWTLAPDIDVRLGGKVLIRHSTVLSGALWDEAQDIVPSAAGNQTQKQVPLLEGTYLVRFEDDTGRRSTNSATAIADLPTPQPRLLVQQFAEDQLTPTPFSGTKTNMSYDAFYDALILNSSGGSVLPEGSYAFATTLNLGAVYDLNLRRRFVTRAFLPNGTWDDKVGLIDDWPAIDDSNLDAVNARLQVRSTEDNPAGTPTWSAWREFSNALARGRGFQFRLIATSSDEAQNILVDELGVITELQQRSESSAPLNSGAGTYTATFASAFFAAPSIGITAYNMGTGDYFVIANVTRTGFQVTFRNPGGAPVNRQFTYTAVGYGREIT